MADYLALIVTASFFCALISSLMPEKGAGKSARTVINIVMLAIVVIPIIRTISIFSNNLTFPVINDGSSHIIDNKEDGIRVYREWLAETTADELSREIKKSVKENINIDVRVECPWHFDGENVVFDEIRIYTKADGRSYKTIVNFVKLHFSLSCTVEAEWQN